MARYRTNGEYWYRDMQPLLKRLRRWLASTGWETPHWGKDGYSYRWQARHSVGLALRARGHRSRTFALYSSMCPLSLFGGRLTFQPFGVSWYARKVKGWYCLNYDFMGKGKATRKRWYAYRSHNATPWGADTWYFGAPREVVLAAQATHDQRVAASEERELRSNLRCS